MKIEALDPLPVDSPEGKLVPNFRLRDLQGREFSLYELLNLGNYVLLNFWATWCPPCLDELPSMEDLNQRWKGRLFTMLAISVDDQPRDIQVFLDRLKPREPSFLILHDPGKMVANGLFGTEKYPETYLIGPDRKLLKKFVGPRHWTNPGVLAELESLIEIKAQ